MNPWQVKFRLVLYALIASITAFVSGMDDLRDADWIGITKLFLCAGLSGLIAVRAFIDSSTTDNTPNKPTL